MPDMAMPGSPSHDTEREAQWAACAARWTNNAHPLIHLSQMLGHAEQPILRLGIGAAQARPESGRSFRQASNPRLRILRPNAANSRIWAVC
ncbi:hypothetical protein [Sphingomonas sp. UNC305MFCol5.2]|uniref:hypothetical protein n=1 Tax=Sphingomonas sp. UNC305MFCol5.2 TaxID=1449076 RepID=UPI00040B4FBD|nr:hypothetical protein [Sphingomonas sp. UNC305MFCol5.2]